MLAAGGGAVDSADLLCKVVLGLTSCCAVEVKVRWEL